MKGVPGLLVAVTLGLVGAFCNWFYLAQKSRELDKVEFIGIAEGVQINPGDKIKESDLVPIPIPRLSVGDLEVAAPLYAYRNTVVGIPATKSYLPGEIILRQDLRTPPPIDLKEKIGDNERVMWIPVDTRTFVPSLVAAGDQVSFIVPRLATAFPTPAPNTGAGGKPGEAGGTEMIGPFRILALGNRLGTAEVQKAAGVSLTQENVMAVAVKVNGSALDELGQKLSDLLRITNFQQVQVLLHPKDKPRGT